MYKILVVISTFNFETDRSYAAVSQEIISFDSKDDAETAMSKIQQMTIPNFNVKVTRLY